MIKLVIFDMDGLMIDNEPLHHKAFDLVFREYGKTLTREFNNKYYVGISDADAANDMVKRFSLPLTPQELVAKKQIVYLNLLSSEIKPKEGLMNLLIELHKNNIKKVVASGSMLKEIKLIIDKLNISQYLDGYYSAEQVKNGKPAPDLFLFAADKLGILPEECLVLEDAPSGIKAAKKAGMKCFAIPSIETVDKDFSDATRTLKSLKDVYLHLLRL